MEEEQTCFNDHYDLSGAWVVANTAPPTNANVVAGATVVLTADKEAFIAAFIAEGITREAMVAHNMDNMIGQTAKVTSRPDATNAVFENSKNKAGEDFSWPLAAIEHVVVNTPATAPPTEANLVVGATVKVTSDEEAFKAALTTAGNDYREEYSPTRGKTLKIKKQWGDRFIAGDRKNSEGGDFHWPKAIIEHVVIA